MLGLVLAGGGSKGAYQIGAWRALIELDKKIDVVVGTSIGSLNAALIAQNDMDKALRTWFEYDAGKMFGVENYDELEIEEKTALSIKALAKETIDSGGSDAVEYKTAILENVDEKKVRESGLKVGVVTVELESREGVEMSLDDMKEGQLVDYIMASSALVPAIKPYEIEGLSYIDGGFYDNVPINFAYRLGAREFIVVDLKSIGFSKKRKSSISSDRVKYIKPYWDLGNVLVFDKDMITRNMTLGYYDTLKKFEVYDGNAYTFYKDDKYFDDFEPRLAQIVQEDEDNKSKFNILDSWGEAKLAKMVEQHNEKGCKEVRFELAILEMLAETFEISPEKIYTIEEMTKKIKEAIREVSDTENEKGGILGKLSNMIDEKKRIKSLANSIKYDENYDKSKLYSIAILDAKTVIMSLYLCAYDLI